MLILFVGDSLTDGSAWTDWVVETLRANGRPAIKQDAGIAGDNVAKLKARFQHDVLDHKPDVVVLNIGTNDRESVEEYRRDVGEMVRQVRATGAKLLLCIPPGINDPKEPARDARIVAYGEALREIAKEYDCTLVDLHAAFAGKRRAASVAEASAPPSPDIVWGPDGVHHTINGWRTMGRAVLDALGCSKPMLEKVSIEPGLLTEWMISPPVAWKTGQPYPALPGEGGRKFDRVAEIEGTSWWQKCWLERGGVMPMGQLVVKDRPGAAATEQAAFAVTTVESAEEKPATLRLGGSPGFAVWVNGELVWEGKALRGYHPDADRVKVMLRKGQNQIAVLSNWIVYVGLEKSN